MQHINIRGAKTHNLKNISCQIPRDSLVVITGLSGSGKSSLAFDTLYAEGQRRYVESLSSYARQFLSMMEKPDVELIEGLSPAISIEQKSTSHNPRSTVGTITEIHDYLRLLFARVGQPYCPEHNEELKSQTVSNMVDSVMELKGKRLMILAPIVRNRKGEHLQMLEQIKIKGFVRVRVNGEVFDIDNIPRLLKNTNNTIEVVVDRVKIKPEIEQRLAESFEMALHMASGLAIVSSMDEDEEFADIMFSAKFSCSQCGYSISELEPRLFSFNNPNGACQKCDGLGKQQVFDPELIIREQEASLSQGAIAHWEPRNPYTYSMLSSVAKHYGFSLETPYKKLNPKHRDIILYGSKKEEILFTYQSEKLKGYQSKRVFEGVIPNYQRRLRETDSMAVREELGKYINIKACETCNGGRLRKESVNVFIAERNIVNISDDSIEKNFDFFKNLELTGIRQSIAERILKEITDRLGFLNNVGLNYLTLSRSAETLSGGEAQRIRLASQIGSGLVGVMYVLDEPSIGLHQRDNNRLLNALKHLKALGNTVIIVEHDLEAIETADFILDIGPGAGVHGGEIVASGSYENICNSPESITGQYLSGKQKIAIPQNRRKPNDKFLNLTGATGNNLKNIDISIPLGLFTCVTGVSGSGKSTLINHTLYPIAALKLMRAHSHKTEAYSTITGLELLDKVINIDQSPIGRTPRSNPATYVGLFTLIRDIFSQTRESRSRGYKPGRFSFNVKGGRCEACSGDGVIKVEMHFLADVYVTCDQCEGKRYGRETLGILYKGKNIAEVLDLTVADAQEFFKAIPSIKRKLDTLMEVGLSYIKLGQNATKLSGGEAQRVKLAKELARVSTGKTLYIFDEPTTGLHFHDIAQLLKVMHKLTDSGNTLIVIEHNLDVIKTADWVIDLGPEGGDGGGEIIAIGTPEEICKNKKSHTAKFLKDTLAI